MSHGNGVADFQYFMVERLRGELGRLKDQQLKLISTTRANINNQNRIHAAVLFLLDARTFEQLIQTITTDLAVLLDLDVAALVVEANGAERPHVHTTGVRVVELGTVDGWLGKRDVMLYSDLNGDPAIFGGGAGLVRSQALIRIQVSEDTPAGLLAFGSRDPEMFHSGQGTELVCFLARVIERSIRAWLDLPEESLRASSDSPAPRMSAPRSRCGGVGWRWKNGCPGTRSAPIPPIFPDFSIF